MSLQGWKDGKSISKEADTKVILPSNPIEQVILCNCQKEVQMKTK